MFTPRANPQDTSLLNLVVQGPDSPVPSPAYKVLYEGQNHLHSCYETKEDQPDVLAIVSNRRQLTEVEAEMPIGRSDYEGSNKARHLASDDIILGKGWQHIGEFPGDCDGTYDAICGRHTDHTCPLIGDHDSRGALVGNEYSGWMVLNIPSVSQGVILLKLVTWYTSDQNTVTEGWTSVNNEAGGRVLVEDTAGGGNMNTTSRIFGEYNVHEVNGEFISDRYYVDGIFPESHRVLGEKKMKNSEIPDTFEFEYAINGERTSLNKSDFVKRLLDVQRVVEVFPILDDENFGAQTDVQVAFRLKGCQRKCTFGLTHVYWA